MQPLLDRSASLSSPLLCSLAAIKPHWTPRGRPPQEATLYYTAYCVGFNVFIPGDFRHHLPRCTHVTLPRELGISASYLLSVLSISHIASADAKTYVLGAAPVSEQCAIARRLFPLTTADQSARLVSPFRPSPNRNVGTCRFNGETGIGTRPRCRYGRLH